MIDKTNICCIDTPKQIVDYLNESHSVYEGSLGKILDLSAKRQGSHFVLSQFDIPENIREYDVFVVDLKRQSPVPYTEEDNTRKWVTGEQNMYFLSKGNQTVYDTIPFGAYWLGNELAKPKKRQPIIIIFQGAKYDSNYLYVDRLSGNNYREVGEEKFSNYEFAKSLPFLEVESGQQVVVEDKRVARLLFKGIERELCYKQTFKCPQKFNQNKQEFEDDPSFFPLLYNRNGDIISFCIISGVSPIYFVLPQASDEIKLRMLKCLFEDVLYDGFSDYFPLIENARWIHNEMYSLPGILDLDVLIAKAEQEFQEKKRLLENEKEKIVQQYSFLQQLITATGDELTDAMIQYLRWLGFEKVINKDTTAEEVYEEDIQVDLDEKGLLVIEVKGIHGTSQDSECSQISKIKHRRERERGKWDVFALYVVNHQRETEPHKRQNPPFNDRQIQDAINDERGLLSTWQLNNTFKAIEMGVISKRQVREDLLQYGLITFHPDMVQPLNTPYNEWQNGMVLGIDVSTQIAVGDKLFVERDGCWHVTEITSIEQDGKRCQSVTSGKTGVGISQKLPKGEIFVRICKK